MVSLTVGKSNKSQVKSTMSSLKRKHQGLNAQELKFLHAGYKKYLATYQEVSAKLMALDNLPEDTIWLKVPEPHDLVNYEWDEIHGKMSSLNGCWNELLSTPDMAEDMKAARLCEVKTVASLTIM